MSARYELKVAPGHRFTFYLKAANGETILAGETYRSKFNALQAIESVRANCLLSDRFERKHSAHSQPFFVLRSASEEILGRSETYASEGACEKGIRSVMRNGP
ncbi:MAG TPA: YegP family protein, partial [Edaphobacter sp.]|nr:YegP family protein [Edaphobacter sp.]